MSVPAAHVQSLIVDAVHPFHRASPEFTPSTEVVHPSGMRCVKWAGFSSSSKLSCQMTRLSVGVDGVSSESSGAPSSGFLELLEEFQLKRADEKLDEEDKELKDDWAVATGDTVHRPTAASAAGTRK